MEKESNLCDKRRIGKIDERKEQGKRWKAEAGELKRKRQSEGTVNERGARKEKKERKVRTFRSTEEFWTKSEGK